MNPTDAAARTGISQQILQGRAGDQFSPESVDTARKGRSGAAVGQQAKAAVAAAIEAGIDVPRNAQGLAASSIARGADPAALFAAQVQSGDDMPPGAGTESLGPAAPDPEVPGAAGDPFPAANTVPSAGVPLRQTDPTVAAYSDTSSTIAPVVSGGTEVALQLLQDVTV